MENILIKDKKAFEQKLNKIKSEGRNSLHVIADFDKTLTKAFVKGQRTHSAMAQIREGGYLTKYYAPKAFALHDKYYPIEISKKIPQEIKNKKMQEWWSKHIKLLAKCGMNRDVVLDIIKKKKLRARGGALELFDVLHKKNIPIVIFSAAVGDIIEEFLKSEGKLYDNICIVSDFFDYDKNGKVKGYKSDIIHIFNKNGYELRKLAFFERIKNRKNMILLGDSLADLNMAQGIDYKTILKI
ncbi:MAG: haloacid dehalogenase-like hydrolase, partial [Nanoarchaeota archaeon]|nr:haloacid dehalogenase-like hydrolase [Nanoarchaeota archaeon]